MHNIPVFNPLRLASTKHGIIDSFFLSPAFVCLGPPSLASSFLHSFRIPFARSVFRDRSLSQTTRTHSERGLTTTLATHSDLGSTPPIHTLSLLPAGSWRTLEGGGSADESLRQPRPSHLIISSPLNELPYGGHRCANSPSPGLSAPKSAINPIFKVVHSLRPVSIAR